MRGEHFTYYIYIFSIETRCARAVLLPGQFLFYFTFSFDCRWLYSRNGELVWSSSAQNSNDSIHPSFRCDRTCCVYIYLERFFIVACIFSRLLGSLLCMSMRTATDRGIRHFSLKHAAVHIKCTATTSPYIFLYHIAVWYTTDRWCGGVPLGAIRQILQRIFTQSINWQKPCGNRIPLKLLNLFLLSGFVCLHCNDKKEYVSIYLTHFGNDRIGRGSHGRTRKECTASSKDMKGLLYLTENSE